MANDDKIRLDADVKPFVDGMKEAQGALTAMDQATKDYDEALGKITATGADYIAEFEKIEAAYRAQVAAIEKATQTQVEYTSTIEKATGFSAEYQAAIDKLAAAARDQAAALSEAQLAAASVTLEMENDALAMDAETIAAIRATQARRAMAAIMTEQAIGTKAVSVGMAGMAVEEDVATVSTINMNRAMQSSAILMNELAMGRVRGMTASVGMLSQSLGVGPGLAGIAGMAALAGVELYRNWDKIAPLFEAMTTKIPESTDKLTRLKDELSEVGEELKKYKEKTNLNWMEMIKYNDALDKQTKLEHEKTEELTRQREEESLRGLKSEESSKIAAGMRKAIGEVKYDVMEGQVAQSLANIAQATGQDVPTEVIEAQATGLIIAASKGDKDARDQLVKIIRQGQNERSQLVAEKINEFSPEAEQTRKAGEKAQQDAMKAKDKAEADAAKEAARIAKALADETDRVMRETGKEAGPAKDQAAALIAARKTAETSTDLADLKRRTDLEDQLKAEAQKHAADVKAPGQAAKLEGRLEAKEAGQEQRAEQKDENQRNRRFGELVRRGEGNVSEAQAMEQVNLEMDALAHKQFALHSLLVERANTYAAMFRAHGARWQQLNQQLQNESNQITLLNMGNPNG